MRWPWPSAWRKARPQRLAMIRRLYWDSPHNSYEAQIDLERQSQQRAGRTADFAEGRHGLPAEAPGQVSGEIGPAVPAAHRVVCFMRTAQLFVSHALPARHIPARPRSSVTCAPRHNAAQSRLRNPAAFAAFGAHSLWRSNNETQHAPACERSLRHPRRHAKPGRRRQARTGAMGCRSDRHGQIRQSRKRLLRLCERHLAEDGEDPGRPFAHRLLHQPGDPQREPHQDHPQGA